MSILRFLVPAFCRVTCITSCNASCVSVFAKYVYMYACSMFLYARWDACFLQDLLNSCSATVILSHCFFALSMPMICIRTAVTIT